jgi:hypothetical protein
VKQRYWKIKRARAPRDPVLNSPQPIALDFHWSLLISFLTGRIGLITATKITMLTIDTNTV